MQMVIGQQQVKTTQNYVIYSAFDGNRKGTIEEINQEKNLKQQESKSPEQSKEIGISRSELEKNEIKNAEIFNKRSKIFTNGEASDTTLGGVLPDNSISIIVVTTESCPTFKQHYLQALNNFSGELKAAPLSVKIEGEDQNIPITLLGMTNCFDKGLAISGLVISKNVINKIPFYYDQQLNFLQGKNGKLSDATNQFLIVYKKTTSTGESKYYLFNPRNNPDEEVVKARNLTHLSTELNNLGVKVPNTSAIKKFPKVAVFGCSLEQNSDTNDHIHE